MIAALTMTESLVAIAVGLIPTLIQVALIPIIVGSLTTTDSGDKVEK